MRRASVHGLLFSDKVWAPPPLDRPIISQYFAPALPWSIPGLSSFQDWVAPILTSSPKSTADRFKSPPDSSDHGRESDSILSVAISAPSLHMAIDDLLSGVRPTRLALDHRNKVVTFIQIVLSATLGVKVVPHGSFALKTFLPDSDVNLSSFFTRNHDKSWFQRVIRALSSDNSESIDPYIRGPQHRFPQPHLSVGVKSAFFTSAPDGTRSIRIEVNGVPVEIGCNQGRSVSMTAFMEDIDRRIGHNSLVKQTLMLTKLWLDNEARVGKLLPTAAVNVIVLHAFTIESADIRHPLQGMMHALDVFSAHDWRQNIFTIFGPLSTRNPSSLHIAMTSLAHSSRSPIDISILARHSDDFRVGVDMKKDDDGNLIMLQPSVMNIMDPLDTSANITSRITQPQAVEILNLVSTSLSVLKSQLRSWGDSGFPSASSWLRSVPFRRSAERYKASLMMRQMPNVDNGPSLQADLDFLNEQVRHAGKFDMPKIAESDLIRLMESILDQNGGTVTVGKMGSLMHEATNNHSLPAMIKSRFGGLKKLLKRHDHIFYIASDHPHNPHVSLRPIGLRRSSLDRDHQSASPYADRIVSPSNKMGMSPQSMKLGSFSLSGDKKSSSAGLDLTEPPKSDESLPDWMATGPAIPSEFICPLTGKMFNDPVTSSKMSSRTYERSALMAKLQQVEAMSPSHKATFAGIAVNDIVPNETMRLSISRLIKQCESGAVSAHVS